MPMARKPDWKELSALFNRSAPSIVKGNSVIYLGEKMPKWLACDLIQERAAIYKYEAGMTREDAEVEARKGQAP